MTLSIVKGVPKPQGISRSSVAGQKYPLAAMEVGDSFFVSYSEMKDGDTPQKFRNRIHQSCKNYALRDKGEGTERKQFTVALMPEDDKDNGEQPRWFAGDVGVWRDQ